MTIPTEPIGSIPRAPALIDAIHAYDAGALSESALQATIGAEVADTVARFEATGSPVVTDGEQGKFQNFVTYPVHGAPNVAGEGFRIPFAAGHVRRLPVLRAGPLRFERTAAEYVRRVRGLTKRAIKQAVIAPSALSLLYPDRPVAGYPRDAFIADLLAEHERELRECIEAGASSVQIDFTEGRLALKLDATGALLTSFVHLNNLALDRLTEAERRKVGVHTCSGGDRDSTHSADVPYAALLPSLFELEVTNFFVALSREPDREAVLLTIARHMKPHHKIFVGVVDPCRPEIDHPFEVRDRVLEAARHIPLDQLGTTDDCGYAPFCDDRSTSRDTAFAKIAARVEGTALAARILLGG